MAIWNWKYENQENMALDTLMIVFEVHKYILFAQTVKFLINKKIVLHLQWITVQSNKPVLGQFAIINAIEIKIGTVVHW